MNLQRKGNGSTNIIISKYGIKCQIKQSKQFQPTLLYEDKYEITCWYLIRPPLLSSEEICRVYLKQSKYVRTKSLLVLVYIYICIIRLLFMISLFIRVCYWRRIILSLTFGRLYMLKFNKTCTICFYKFLDNMKEKQNSCKFP